MFIFYTFLGLSRRTKWYWIKNWDYQIQAILQIFNRIHKAAVQDPSILNVAEDFLDYQTFLNHKIPDNIWDPLNYLKMVIKWMLYGVT